MSSPLQPSVFPALDRRAGVARCRTGGRAHRPRGNRWSPRTREDAAPSGDAEALRQEVQRLRQRVAELELKLAEAGVPTDTEGGEIAMEQGAAAVNWGRVQSIETVEPDTSEAAKQRVDELQKEVDKLRDELTTARQDVAEADIKTASSGRDADIYNAGTRYDEANAEAEIKRELEQTRDQVRAAGVEASELSDRYRVKQNELRQARRAMQPHRVITVTRDGKTIKLEAQETGTNAVEVDPSWAAVRWTGELLSSEAGSQRWEARRIQPLTEDELQRLEVGSGVSRSCHAAIAGLWRSGRHAVPRPPCR